MAETITISQAHNWRSGSASMSVLSLIGISFVAAFYFVTWPRSDNSDPGSHANSLIASRPEPYGESSNEQSTAIPYGLRHDASKTIAPIELGIVRSNEVRRLLFPIARLGIPNGTEIDSINTSCDCIHFSVVEMADTNESSKRLIAIEHRPEVGSKAGMSMSLRVTCDVRLADESTSSFQIDFDSLPITQPITPSTGNKVAKPTSPEPMALATGDAGTEPISNRTSKPEPSDYGSVARSPEASAYGSGSEEALADTIALLVLAREACLAACGGS